MANLASMEITDDTRRIVCGLDDSEHAGDVAAAAALLANRLGVRLQLVHSAHQQEDLPPRERRRAIRRGKALLHELAGDDAPHDAIVGVGDPLALLNAALSEDTVLVVMGSRGRGPARAALFGSVSNALAASAPCPVVVLPPGARVNLANPAAVFCGVDGSAEADSALHHASALADALDGMLVAVHVREALRPSFRELTAPVGGPRRDLDVIERAVAGLDGDTPVTMRVEFGDAIRALREMADEHPSSILVVGSRGQRPARAAFLGSTSSALAATTRAPVMIVPRTAGQPRFGGSVLVGASLR